MMLDLRALENLPARVTLQEEADRLDVQIDGALLLGKATAELDIVPGDQFYYCRGVAVCEAELACSRCLDPYHVTLRGDVEFSIREAAGEVVVNGVEVAATEYIVSLGTAEIDIAGPVREALILELPLKPLCREECRGLCPVCGVNRNERACDCKVEKTDSRWDGLRNLLE